MDDNGTYVDSWNSLNYTGEYANYFDDTSTNYSFLNSTESEHINPFYFFETVQFTVLWILFFSIVIGNGAVLIALFLSNSRKSRTKYFIKHLALADLLVGLISVLTDIIWRTIIIWRAGLVLCKLVKFSQMAVTYYSTYVLVALSIDRFDAITRPMNFRGSFCLIKGGSCQIIQHMLEKK